MPEIENDNVKALLTAKETALAEAGGHALLREAMDFAFSNEGSMKHFKSGQNEELSVDSSLKDKAGKVQRLMHAETHSGKDGNFSIDMRETDASGNQIYLTTHLDFKTDISGTHMDGVTEDINGKVVEKTYSFFQRFGNQNYIVTVDKDARDKVTGFSNTSYVPAPFGIAMDSKQAEALPTKEANKYEQKVTGVAHIHTTDGVDDTTNTIFKAERR